MLLGLLIAATVLVLIGVALVVAADMAEARREEQVDRVTGATVLRPREPLDG